MAETQHLRAAVTRQQLDSACAARLGEASAYRAPRVRARAPLPCPRRDGRRRRRRPLLRLDVGRLADRPTSGLSIRRGHPKL